MTPWLALALVLAALLLVGAVLRPHHAQARTERVIDPYGTGERRTFGVCRCGASKPLPDGRWSHFLCRCPR